MSRILLLIVFMIWLAWTPAHPAVVGPVPPPLSPAFAGARPLLFLSGYALLVLFMGLWSRLLARRVDPFNLHRSVRRFNRSMDVARILVPTWFAAGVLLLNWKLTVFRSLGPWSFHNADIETPALLAGTLPAFLAWMGLWWSQFPADRALREQNLLIQLDQAMPIHAPPGFRSYFAANLRLQLLFTIVPVLLILATKDLAALALRPALNHVPDHLRAVVENGVMFAAAAAVFLLAPEILRRVLHTSPLPDSPLRQRLDAMCRRHGLRYRGILLWHTQGNMGNAAVMGVLPSVRYVLLSDLLLETMTDPQIEAVFAHELGHIVHRHMVWYVVFVLTLMFALAGPGSSLDSLLPDYATGDLASALLMALGCCAFLLIFGYVSRRFERQADVFAARTIESHHTPIPSPLPVGWAPPTSSTPSPPHPLTPSPGTPDDWRDADLLHPSLPPPVLPYGATLFASALERVAIINNIPIAARSWCHGSIAKRMQYLHTLSHDPTHTHRFDRLMRRLYWALILSLLLTGAWTLLAIRQGL